MSRFFGALARGVSGARKGNNLAEQEQYDRGLQERELQSRAAQEFVRNAQWERQQRYQQERDQMVDQRMRDLDAAEEQRRASDAQNDMANKGWEAATIHDLFQKQVGAKRFQQAVDDVSYDAPEQQGYEYQKVGGKLMRRDKQAQANSYWQQEATKALARQKEREDRQAQETAMRNLIVSTRPQPQPQPKPQAGRPLPESARLKVNLETQANQTAIRDLDRAIAATTGVKDFAGPVDDFAASARNGWLQGVMKPQPKIDNARAEYARVVTPIITGAFGAALTETEKRIISPYVSELAKAREEQVPAILSRIRDALQDAQNERVFTLEASGVDTEWLGNLPARPSAPAPTTGGRKPGQNPSQRAETPAERRKRLLRGGS